MELVNTIVRPAFGWQALILNWFLWNGNIVLKTFIFVISFCLFNFLLCFYSLYRKVQSTALKIPAFFSCFLKCITVFCPVCRKKKLHFLIRHNDKEEMRILLEMTHVRHACCLMFLIIVVQITGNECLSCMFYCWRTIGTCRVLRLPSNCLL